MSNRRKQQQEQARRQKTRGAIVTAVVVILVLAAVAWGIWWQFLRVKPVSAFLPRDPTSVVFVNINSDSSQVKTVKDLGEVFGSRDFFPSVLQDILLPQGDQYVDVDKEEIKLWFGNTVAIAKVPVADRAIDMIVVEIDNQQKAQEFAETFKTNLEQKGRAVSEEVFRGNVITSIEGGDNPLHFSLLPNHLLISERVDGVRQMIDAERGRVASLETSKEFRRAQKRVSGEQDSLLFFVVDAIEVIRLLPNLTSQLDPSVIAGLFSGGARLNIYGTVIAENDGAYLNAFLGEDLSNQELPRLKPRFAELLPADTLFLLESSSIRTTLEGLLFEQSQNAIETEEARAAISYLLRTQYDLSYEDDIMRLLKGPYALAILPPEINEEPPIALFLDMTKEDDAGQIIGRLEQALVGWVNTTYPSTTGQDRAFTTHTIGNESYRFLNLPDELSIDLAIKQQDDTLILTTTRSAMETVMTTQELSDDARLAEHPPYRVTLEDVERSDMTRLIYIDTQDLLRLGSDEDLLDYATLDDSYKIPDEFVGITWKERVGSTTRGFLNIF